MARKVFFQTKIRILAGALVVLVGLGVVLWQNVFVQAVPEVSAVEEMALGKPEARVSTMRESTGVPVRLKIASIDLDAPIEQVGLTADGLMDVPKHPFNTGWYELGPRPGEMGSAAIAGHVDWIDGSAAVFADLNKVQVGDRVTVEDNTGAVVSFLVRDIRTYDAGADAADVFISDDGKAHLNIITCHGAWDKGSQQYSKRLVVFTDKE